MEKFLYDGEEAYLADDPLCVPVDRNDEKRLGEQIRAGDQIAANNLLARNIRFIRQRATSLAGNNDMHAAQDIINETCVRVCPKIMEYDANRYTFTAFLYPFIREAARIVYKGRNRRKKKDLLESDLFSTDTHDTQMTFDDFPDPKTEMGKTVFDPIDLQRWLNLLPGAIESLREYNTEYAKIIELRYGLLDGKDRGPTAIGKMMNPPCSKANIQQKLMKAHSKLLIILKQVTGLRE